MTVVWTVDLIELCLGQSSNRSVGFAHLCYVRAR